MAMAAAACVHNNKRPLSRVLARAFRAAAAAAAHGPSASNDLARRQSRLLCNHDATWTFGVDSSSSFSSSSHGVHWLTRGPKGPGFSRTFASGGEPAHEKITMPALSPTMTQGNVVQWKKKEGDKVTAGDVLCEIETDKATLDLEAMEDGFVRAVRMVVIKKSTVYTESFLAKILAPADSKDIPVGQPLCIVVEDEEDVGKFKDFAGQEPAKSESTKADTGRDAESSGTSAAEPPPAPAAGPKKNRTGPSVRRYLAESGLDASSVVGTGPNGMLVKSDILSAMKSGRPKQKEISAGPETSAKRTAPSPASASPPSTSLTAAAPLSEAGPYTDIPNIQIRKIIAKRLLESKTQIPHFYLSTDAIVDATLGLRKELKEKHGTSISVNDFVIRAVALALRDVPEANASWDEKSGGIKLSETIDISVAVATDKGLITPILKNADKKSLSEISKEVKSLAEKARTGKLKPQEFQGGTFSISNLGMFSVDRFSAIINPPQACILAVGRGVKAADWSEDVGQPVAVTKMGLTLSADNRVYNGEIGGRFLEALSKNLADPKNMLL